MANTIRTKGFEALLSALVDERQKTGMSQRDLAEKLGCFPATIGKIESGGRRIDVIELIVLAEALDSDAVQLFKVALDSVSPDELKNNFSRSKRRL